MEKEKAHNLITSPYMMFKVICRFAKLCEMFSLPKIFDKVGWGNLKSQQSVDLSQEKYTWKRKKFTNLITTPYMMKLYTDLQNYVKLYSLSSEYLSRWGWKISSQRPPFPRK